MAGAQHGHHRVAERHNLDTDIGHVDFGLGFDITASGELGQRIPSTSRRSRPAWARRAPSLVRARRRGLRRQDQPRPRHRHQRPGLMPTSPTWPLYGRRSGAVASLLAFREGPINGTSAINDRPGPWPATSRTTCQSRPTAQRWSPIGDPDRSPQDSSTGRATRSPGSVAEFNAALESADSLRHRPRRQSTWPWRMAHGRQLADPGVDRILFWDDQPGRWPGWRVGTGLAITATQIDATGAAAATLAEDTTPQLGGNLDLNGFTVGVPPQPPIHEAERRHVVGGRADPRRGHAHRDRAELRGRRHATSRRSSTASSRSTPT